MKIQFKQNFISQDDIQFSFKVDPITTLLGTLATLYVSTWRAQFSLRCKELNIKDSKIQSLETAKIQSRLLNVDKPVKKFFSVISYRNTILYDAKDYQKAEDKDAFVETRVKEVMKPGECKILSKNQIQKPEDVTITRRGIVARLRGNIQATSMFKFHEIFDEYVLANLDFVSFVDSYVDFFAQTVNITRQAVIEMMIDFLKSRSELDVSILNSAEIGEVQLARVAKEILLIVLFKNETFILADGIKEFSGNIKAPLLPIESGFGENLYRPEPKELPLIENLDPNSNDPIIMEILAQQQDRMVEIKPKGKRGKKK